MSFPPFQHHGWIGYEAHVPDDEPRVIIARKRVTHCLIWMKSGSASGVSVLRGREKWLHLNAGQMHFFPADGEEQTLIARRQPARTVYTLLIPEHSIDCIATSEGMSAPPEPHSLISLDDGLLHRCLMRLAKPSECTSDIDAHREETARSLVVRLAELMGGRRAEWRSDAAAFRRATFENLVASIDANLRTNPTAETMAPLVGLSQSHFARKFRLSAGMSLQSFVNQRRVRASIDLLRRDSMPLSHVAVELGFSSQSHFTRLFSERTGMTPAKFRKQFGRKVSLSERAHTL